jgi:ABC-type oligopeptide transport system substrate-binding subunit
MQEAEVMAKERVFSRLLVATLAVALLASCGGGGEASSGAAGETSPPADTGGTGVATLSWSAPIENIDGSSVTNLAGYRIYHGTNPNALHSMIQVSNPGITLYVMDGLASGVHYFAISAYNAVGMEGNRSAVASKTIH